MNRLEQYLGWSSNAAHIPNTMDIRRSYFFHDVDDGLIDIVFYAYHSSPELDATTLTPPVIPRR